MIVENQQFKENSVENTKLKVALSNLLLKQSKMKRNTCVAFSPQNHIAFGSDTKGDAKIIKIQKLNPNDEIFIQKFSYLIKEKANDLVQMQNKESIGEDIAKIYTLKIRENLIGLINNLDSDNLKERFLQEARSYLVLWIFFEYMIVFYNEINHLLTIRDFFYKYFFEIDLETFELFKNRNFSEYLNNNSIDTQLNKLKFLMRICDFNEMQKILANLSYLLKYDKDNQIKYPGVNLEFAEIFDHLSIICEHYIQVVNREDGNNFGDYEKNEFNRNIQTVCNSIWKYFNCINEVTSKSNLSQFIKNNITELEREVNLIMDIFNGDIEGIKQICENYKEWILMNIYYRFYLNNFYDELKNGLSHCENHDNDILDNLIMSTIVNNPFEFYQNLKEKIPKWLQFHFMDILYDLEVLPTVEEEYLDGMTLRNYEYVDFMNYLMLLDVSIEDFINYSTLYDYSKTSGTFLIFLEKIVIKNVLSKFKNFEKNLITKKNLKIFLENVMDQLNLMRHSLVIINSACKISFEKFMELKHYKTAVYFYSFINLGNIQPQHDNFFDKLLMVILQSESFPHEMRKLAKLKCSINNEKFGFLIRLINFFDITEEYDASIKIKEFFNYCFVEQNCPKLMWLYTLKLFKQKQKENFEIFREIKYEDYKSAFDHHCSNEIRISKKKIIYFSENEIRKFFRSNLNLFNCESEEAAEEFLEREFYSLTQYLFENQIISYTR